MNNDAWWKNITRHNKSIVSALVAGIGLWLSSKDHGMTADEWYQVLLAALAAGGATWAIPNKPKVKE